MGKGMSVSPVNVRPVNKVLKNKKARGNIHNSFRRDHKAAEVKVKHEHLKQLKEQMSKQIFGVTEEQSAANGTKLNVAV